jgi:ADP-heptose:LPS heptosyltransferase
VPTGHRFVSSRMFTVLMYGGIGDTLRNLSIFPHRSIHRLTGLRTTAVYKHWRLTGEHQYANPPGTEFFQAMADRFESLRWGGETTANRGLGAYTNRLVRELVKVCHGGTPPYFPLEPKLSAVEMAELPDLGRGPVIAVQTHLLGTWTKAWGLERWQRFIALLLEQIPDARIVVIEPSQDAEKLVVAPGVITTHRLNLYQLLHLVRSFHLTISVDSWAKYAAAWNHAPQIVIVPDQRPQYPVLTADHLIQLQFAGIFGEPRNRTIGLERDGNGRGVLTLEHIDRLTPDMLLREAMEKLQKFPPRLSP